MSATNPFFTSLSNTRDVTVNICDDAYSAICSKAPSGYMGYLGTDTKNELIKFTDSIFESAKTTRVSGETSRDSIGFAKITAVMNQPCQLAASDIESSVAESTAISLLIESQYKSLRDYLSAPSADIEEFSKLLFESNKIFSAVGVGLFNPFLSFEDGSKPKLYVVSGSTLPVIFKNLKDIKNQNAVEIFLRSVGVDFSNRNFEEFSKNMIAFEQDLYSKDESYIPYGESDKGFKVPPVFLYDFKSVSEGYLDKNFNFHVRELLEYLGVPDFKTLLSLQKEDVPIVLTIPLNQIAKNLNAIRDKHSTLEASWVETGELMKQYFLYKYALLITMPFNQTSKSQSACPLNLHELPSDGRTLPLPYVVDMIKTTTIVIGDRQNGGNLAKKKQLAKEMLKSIKSAMKTHFLESKWIPDVIKTQFLRKLNSIVEMVGYPDFLDSDDNLIKYMDMLFPAAKTEADENGLTNFMSRILKSIPTENTMNSIPATINVYTAFNRHWIRAGLKFIQNSGYKGHTHTYNLNNLFDQAYLALIPLQMTIPMATLSDPILYLPDDETFKNKEQLAGLMAVNFGAFGQIVGHELTHGFDNLSFYLNSQGEEYIKGGDDNYNTVRDHYGTCLTKQLGQYKAYNPKNRSGSMDYDITKKLLSGSNYISETLADHGGKVIAYKAMKEYFESDAELKPYIVEFNELSSESEGHLENKAEPQLIPGLRANTSRLFFLSLFRAYCENATVEFEKRYLMDSHPPTWVRAILHARNSIEARKIFGCNADHRFTSTDDLGPTKKWSDPEVQCFPFEDRPVKLTSASHSDDVVVRI